MGTRGHTVTTTGRAGARPHEAPVGAIAQRLAFLLGLILLIISPLTVSGQTWHNRVFDSLENGRAFGDYFQPFLNTYYSTAALPQPSASSLGTPTGPSYPPSQLLTPSSSASSILAAANQLIKPANSNQGPQAQAEEASKPQASASPDHSATFASEAPSLSASTVPISSTMAGSTSTSTTRAPDAGRPAYQADQQARDVSGQPSASPSDGGERFAAGPTARSPANEHKQTAGGQQQQQNHGKPIIEAGHLSLVGKILDSSAGLGEAASSAVGKQQVANSVPPVNGNEKDSSNVAKKQQATLQESGTGGDKKAHQEAAQKPNLLGQQILKPARKQQSVAEPNGGRKSSVAVEQQIVNQHAKAHHNHHIRRQNQPHRRLMPAKHRDNKLVNALLGTFSADSTSSSSSSSSSQASTLDARQSSPIVSLLGESLKSMGSTISSRSSIVKAAISDNKLSRGKYIRYIYIYVEK